MRWGSSEKGVYVMDEGVVGKGVRERKENKTRRRREGWAKDRE